VGCDFYAKFTNVWLETEPNYKWIQIVTTSMPLYPHTSTSGYVDGPTDDDIPFYYSEEDEETTTSEPESNPYWKHFLDEPRRSHSSGPGGSYAITWSAMTFLVTQTFVAEGEYDVVLHDGFKWGWGSATISPTRVERI